MGKPFALEPTPEAPVIPRPLKLPGNPGGGNLPVETLRKMSAEQGVPIHEIVKSTTSQDWTPLLGWPPVQSGTPFKLE